MAKQATLINEQGLKKVVDVGSQNASSLMGQGYQLMGASGKYTPATIDSTQPINQPAQPAIPSGAVAINGAEFNTAEKQKQAFTNIQPVGNTLYGIPKSPVVPDVMSQQDLGNAMSPQTLAETSAKANEFVGFSEQQVLDLNKANLRATQGGASETDIKNLDYAKSKGWQPSAEAKTPEIVKSTADKLFEEYSNILTIKDKAKAEAMKIAGLDEKSQAIATAESVVNQLRTDLQNKGILDIKEQDIRRNQPLLTSQIAANLNELSREQKLDAMIMQNNYNNALVEQEIAQGHYDRAREIVKETADDAYNIAKDQIEALRLKMEIEDIAATKMEKELEYERDLSLEGYVHIKSPESLNGLSESDIYRDPVSGKIYMKPEPTISRVMEVNGRNVGLDDKGNIVKDLGAVKVSGGGGSGSGGYDTVNIPGVDTSNMTKEEIKALEAKIKEFNNDINKELYTLARGGDWGASWNFIKNKYPGMTNQEVDDALNAWYYNQSDNNNQDIETPDVKDTKETSTNGVQKLTANPGSINWSSPDIKNNGMKLKNI